MFLQIAWKCSLTHSTQCHVHAVCIGVAFYCSITITLSGQYTKMALNSMKDLYGLLCPVLSVL